MTALTKLFTLAVACLLFAGPVVSTSAFSRRHSHHSVPGRRSSKTHHAGSATYYNVEENTGACGEYHNNGEYVAAIGKSLWQQTQGENGVSSMCGRMIALTWQGKTVHVKAVDLCEGCDEHSLDLSPTAFGQLADPNQGRLNGITWKFE